MIYLDIQDIKFKLYKFNNNILDEFTKPLSKNEFITRMEALKENYNNNVKGSFETHSIKTISSIRFRDGLSLDNHIEITIPAKTSWDRNQLLKILKPGARAILHFFDKSFTGVLHTVRVSNTVNVQYKYEVNISIALPLSLLSTVSLSMFQKLTAFRDIVIDEFLWGEAPNDKNTAPDYYLIVPISLFTLNWLELCKYFSPFLGAGKYFYIDETIKTDSIDLEDYLWLMPSYKIISLDDMCVYITFRDRTYNGNLLNIFSDIVHNFEVLLDFNYDTGDQKYYLSLVHLPISPIEVKNTPTQMTIKNPQSLTYERNLANKNYFGTVIPVSAELYKELADFIFLWTSRDVYSIPQFHSLRTSLGFYQDSIGVFSKDIMKGEHSVYYDKCKNEIIYWSKRLTYKTLTDNFLYRATIVEPGLQNLENILNWGLASARVPAENLWGFITTITYDLTQTATTMNATTTYTLERVFIENDEMTNYFNDLYDKWFLKE